MNVTTDHSNIPVNIGTTGSSAHLRDELQKIMDDDEPGANNSMKSLLSEVMIHERKKVTTQSSAVPTAAISYWQLFIDYPMYRYCLLSYIVTQLGEWLTYVASLSILELASTTNNTVSTNQTLHQDEELLSPPQQFDGDLHAMVESTISPQLSFSPASGQKQRQHHFLISMLVVCRLLPNTISSFFGGILADTCDRRMIMLRLDVIGGFVAVVYYIMAVSVFRDSNDGDGDDTEQPPTTIVSSTTVVVLLLCTIAQSAISGLYHPSRSSIVPMLVGEKNNDNIEKANETETILWSISASLGSSLGGFIVDHYGVAVCFATDTILYFTSAIILAIFVRGNYNVAMMKTSTAPATSIKSVTDTANCTPIQKHDDKTHTDIIKNVSFESRNDDPVRKKVASSTSLDSIHNEDTIYGGRCGLIRDVRVYITTHDSAPYLLIKACGALLFGACDVINVTLSQNPESGQLDPQRLGYLFSAVGIGCLVGPLLMPSRRCYLSACTGSFYIIALGYACMAWTDNFWWQCFWTGLRSAGTAVLWVDSSILIQTTTPTTLLGRITSIDYAMALLAEASSAMFAGVGQDYGMPVEQVSLILAGLALFFSFLWTRATIYQKKQRRHFTLGEMDDSSLELEPLHNIS